MKDYLKAISSRLFTRLCRMKGVGGSGRYYVLGRWPDVCNHGDFTMGASTAFRTFRVKTRIDVMRGASLSIGDKGYFNDGVNICCSSSITIGSHVRMADWVMILDTNFHEIGPSDGVRTARVVIGKNVWIGARAIILPGAEIGDHSVIAAGAVVAGVIPPRSLAAGVPAKVVRTFECDDGWIRG